MIYAPRFSQDSKMLVSWRHHMKEIRNYNL